MVIITLEKCPLALRGDLTKWLQEISPGVYVGQVSARVRDKLWERVCEKAKTGRATMVFSARNEQHLDFWVHNSLWEPIDFDGLKLMMRPSPARIQKLQQARLPHGKSGRVPGTYRARQRRASKGEPAAYVVVDVETTGLDPQSDTIIELAALRIIDGEKDEAFSTLVRSDAIIPREIMELTGIATEDLKNGMKPNEAMAKFLEVIGSYPIVMHNSSFDMGFIDVLLERLDIDELENECIDTLALSRKRLPKMQSHRLVDLCALYEIPVEGLHRAMTDCLCTREVFCRLLEE